MTGAAGRGGRHRANHPTTKEVPPMLSSYPVACPHKNCDWTGSLVPSRLRGGADAEIASMHRAWFRCPRCQGDWEVRITNDRVTVLPVVEADRGPLT
jgi:hypothetical protein